MILIAIFFFFYFGLAHFDDLLELLVDIENGWACGRLRMGRGEGEIFYILDTCMVPWFCLGCSSFRQVYELYIITRLRFSSYRMQYEPIRFLIISLNSVRTWMG